MLHPERHKSNNNCPIIAIFEIRKKKYDPFCFSLLFFVESPTKNKKKNAFIIVKRSVYMRHSCIFYTLKNTLHSKLTRYKNGEVFSSPFFFFLLFFFFWGHEFWCESLYLVNKNRYLPRLLIGLLFFFAAADKISLILHFSGDKEWDSLQTFVEYFLPSPLFNPWFRLISILAK